jgi:hypothetical protein
MSLLRTPSDACHHGTIISISITIISTIMQRQHNYVRLTSCKIVCLYGDSSPLNDYYDMNDSSNNSSDNDNAAPPQQQYQLPKVLPLQTRSHGRPLTWKRCGWCERCAGAQIKLNLSSGRTACHTIKKNKCRVWSAHTLTTGLIILRSDTGG